MMAAAALIASACAGSAMAADPEFEARVVMDAFLAAFNARDVDAWAETLHYPHVRLASGAVALYHDRAAFVAAHDLEVFAARSGWHHSTWDDMRVVHAGPDKVHIAVRFTRHDGAGGVLGSYESLYVVERVDGRWGVRARSSFAP
jgi:hypothetical protein